MKGSDTLVTLALGYTELRPDGHTAHAACRVDVSVAHTSRDTSTRHSVHCLVPHGRSSGAHCLDMSTAWHGTRCALPGCLLRLPRTLWTEPGSDKCVKALSEIFFKQKCYCMYITFFV